MSARHRRVDPAAAARRRPTSRRSRRCFPHRARGHRRGARGGDGRAGPLSFLARLDGGRERAGEGHELPQSHLAGRRALPRARELLRHRLGSSAARGQGWRGRGNPPPLEPTPEQGGSPPDPARRCISLAPDPTRRCISLAPDPTRRCISLAPAGHLLDSAAARLAPAGRAERARPMGKERGEGKRVQGKSVAAPLLAGGEARSHGWSRSSPLPCSATKPAGPVAAPAPSTAQFFAVGGVVQGGREGSAAAARFRDKPAGARSLAGRGGAAELEGAAGKERKENGVGAARVGLREEMGERERGEGGRKSKKI
ncbi:unnamed protein product [Urochloa humidicola]